MAQAENCRSMGKWRAELRAALARTDAHRKMSVGREQSVQDAPLKFLGTGSHHFILLTKF